MTPRATGLTPVIVFVRNFDRCVEFYRTVFGLAPLRRDDRWAEFDLGDVHLALHAGYDGEPHRQGRPIALHFVVDDIHAAVERIRQQGGTATVPREFTSRREGKECLEAEFVDPDGNEFEVQEVLRRF